MNSLVFFTFSEEWGKSLPSVPSILTVNESIFVSVVWMSLHIDSSFPFGSSCCSFLFRGDAPDRHAPCVGIKKASCSYYCSYVIRLRKRILPFVLWVVELPFYFLWLFWGAQSDHLQIALSQQVLCWLLQMVLYLISKSALNRSRRHILRSWLAEAISNIDFVRFSQADLLWGWHGRFRLHCLSYRPCQIGKWH